MRLTLFLLIITFTSYGQVNLNGKSLRIIGSDSTHGTVDGTIYRGSDGLLRFMYNGSHYRFNIYGGNVIGSGTENRLAYWTGGNSIAATSAAWDNINSRLTIGNTTSIPVGLIESNIQVTSTTATTGFSLSRYQNNANTAGIINIGKSRGATIGSFTVVQNGDVIGGIDFAAADGTDLVSRTARIFSSVDGIPGANDTPGRLEFHTTPDGSDTPVERMRISNAGEIGIGGTAISGRQLYIASSGAAIERINAATGFNPFLEFTENNNGSAGQFWQVIKETADDRLSFTNGTERMALNSSGAVSFSSSVGTSGQVLTSAGAGGPPTWTTVGTIGGTIAATQVAFGSGSDAITGEAAFTYAAASNLLLVDRVGSNIGTVLQLEGALGVNVNGSEDEITFVNNSTTRLGIEPDGSWRINGSNGTSGQALVSNGSGSTPTWQTVGTGNLSGTLTSGRVLFASGTNTVVDDADLTFSGSTLTATNITLSSLSSTYVPFASTGGSLIGEGSFLYNSASTQLTIGPGGGDQITIDGNGTVGISITDDATNQIQISSNSISMPIGGNMTISPGTGNLRIDGGINNNGGGIKHARVTTGSISAGSTALVTVTWTDAFANANYTVQASVLDSTSSSLSLSVVHIETISASQVQIRVLNNAAGSLTGTLHVIAVHD